MTKPQVIAWPLEPGLLSEGPRWDEERQELLWVVVTTGRERLDEAALESQPDAGRVFSVTGLDASGAACAPYRGRIAPAGLLE